MDQKLIDAVLRELGRRVTGDRPNSTWFNERFRHLDAVTMGYKQMGYALARELGTRRPRRARAPESTPLVSKLATQADCESAWFEFWCRRIACAPVYHRKVWEFAFVAQMLKTAGVLRPGARGIGFGVGTEPLPAAFAEMGCKVLATDQSAGAATASGWAATNQLANGRLALLNPEVCQPVNFANIDFMTLDMNEIPDTLATFDFAWSACALEHLGSIGHGIRFILRTAHLLAPGGCAVHTTEFNLSSESETVDHWPTVLFRRSDIEEMVALLRHDGFQVAPLDLSAGNGILDGFIDVPPYSHPQDAHLKLAVDGFTCTSIGLVIVRPQ